MKKNVIIGILLILTVSLAFLLSIKSSEAELQTIRVTEYQELAELHRKIAEEAEEKAAAEAARAISEKRKAEMAREEAERLLANCK